MFDFLKKKQDTISLWGTLSIKNAEGKNSYVALLASDWAKVESLLNDIRKGIMINLNFQLSGSDSINLDRKSEDAFTLVFYPKAFLKGENVSYYALMQNGKETVNFDLAKSVIGTFFKEGRRNERLNWKEEK